MLLAVDIGNSNIVFALYNGIGWESQWRVETVTGRSEAEYEGEFAAHLLEHQQHRGLISAVVVSSVVPQLTDTLSGMLEKFTGRTPLVIGPEHYSGIKLGIKNPGEIGTDLVANAIAAHHRYEKEGVIVVDFGTALTFTIVSSEGEIVGVNILPGIKTSMKALAMDAAQLEEIELSLPASVIGKDTTHAIRAGILWGYVGLVESMISRIDQELNTKNKVIATGGLSIVFAPLKDLFDLVDPNLTLDGLRIIFQHVKSTLKIRTRFYTNRGCHA